MPQAEPIYVLFNPADPSAEATSKDLQAHAQKLGVQLQLLYADDDSEIDAAFATAASKPGAALVVNADPFFFIRRAQITALAKRQAIPAIYYDREFAVSGGLMTYGTNLPTMWGQAGAYVARILKGETPGDLPVAQPTRFELVVNLQTAKMLGVALPDRVLALADEVIE